MELELTEFQTRIETLVLSTNERGKQFREECNTPHAKGMAYKGARYNRFLNSSTVRPVSRIMLLNVPFATSL